MSQEHSSQSSVSVVIAWVNPLELIVPGLEALANQTRRPAEVIVVTRHGKALQDQFRRHFPDVVLLACEPGTGIPKLRSTGIRHARGASVAVTEDHCVPAPNWIAKIQASMDRGAAVVGGPVENACTNRVRDWAAFLTEYAGVIRPASKEIVNPLPGNNVAYRREIAEDLCDVLDRGLWESFYHQKLIERGIKLEFDPDLLVDHKRPFDFWYFIGQRYHFCKSFAGMRCATFGTPDRLKYGVGSLALPPLLLMRGLKNLRERGRLVDMYLRCSPLIGMYIAVGAFGEMAGYFLGGGRSLERVE